jgi:hypothetical protein
MVIDSLDPQMIIFWAISCNGCDSDDNSSAECDTDANNDRLDAERSRVTGANRNPGLPGILVDRFAQDGSDSGSYFVNSAKAPFQSSGGGLFR